MRNSLKWGKTVTDKLVRPIILVHCKFTAPSPQYIGNRAAAGLTALGITVGALDTGCSILSRARPAAGGCSDLSGAHHRGGELAGMDLCRAVTRTECLANLHLRRKPSEAVNAFAAWIAAHSVVATTPTKFSFWTVRTNPGIPRAAESSSDWKVELLGFLVPVAPP
jgi:hypothetical protein